MAKIDWDELRKLKEEGYVFYRKHPELDLYICKYSPITQYHNYWNDITRKCRGLVIDSEGNIIINSVNKFFNLEEHMGTAETIKGKIPVNEKFKLFEKCDGSLLNVTWYKDKLLVTSSGSFDSDHARIGSDWFNTKYKDVVPMLDEDKTYGFEFIHPNYRIVVDYGDKEELVLLYVRDTETGREYDIENYKHLGFRLPNIYDVSTIDDVLRLQKENRRNEEGFIALFESGFRTKIKFEEYLNLHRFKSETRLIDLWTILKNKKTIEESFSSFLDLIPDEFYQSVKLYEKDLKKTYDDLYKEIKYIYLEILNDTSLVNRKDQATFIIKNHKKYSPVLFKMIDGKPFDSIIWDMFEPNKTSLLF